MQVLSVSEERELKKAIRLVNGNYANAHTLMELADCFERVEKRAHKLGLVLRRASPHTPKASLIHQQLDQDTVLINSAEIEAIGFALSCIRRTEAKDGKPERYEYAVPKVEEEL